jgi:NADPH2:quinone reductase
MKAVFVEKTGGAENLIYGDVPRPEPGAGQALVKVVTSGVNFIDIYFRSGLYPAPPPVVLGMEGAGVVEAVGEGVATCRPGDRVCWAMARGSYADYAVVPAWQLVPVPGGLDFDQAAAAMLQGMTAHYLTHSTFELRPGHTCLVHAAAGGTGGLLVQMAKMRGARVIGTAGSAGKAAKARALGCDEVILYTEKDFAAETKRITGGGVDVVYDGVGKAVFLQSLDCLRPRGMMVTFGNASGPVPAIEPLLLSAKGSLFLTRPTLATHAGNRTELLWRAGDVLRWVRSGALRLTIEKKYPMAEAAAAQTALEGRQSAGKLLLGN